MYFRRAKAVSVLSGVLFDSEFVEKDLDVLEIGHVAACTDNGVVTNCMETLDILEPGQ
jgi:hypothetical protein